MRKKARPQNKTPVERDERGRVAKGGGSLNPGGVPRRSLELRQLALRSAERALQRAIEMVDDADPKVADLGIAHVLNRALGRVGAPSELPDDVQAEGTPDTTPAGLLSLAMTGLARVLAHLNKRAASGQPLSEAESKTLAEAAATLATLAREEREQAKAAPGSAMTQAELEAAVLAALPLERLRAAIAEREGVT